MDPNRKEESESGILDTCKGYDGQVDVWGEAELKGHVTPKFLTWEEGKWCGKLKEGQRVMDHEERTDQENS